MLSDAGGGSKRENQSGGLDAAIIGDKPFGDGATELRNLSSIEGAIISQTKRKKLRNKQRKPRKSRRPRQELLVEVSG